MKRKMKTNNENEEEEERKTKDEERKSGAAVSSPGGGLVCEYRVWVDSVCEVLRRGGKLGRLGR